MGSNVAIGNHGTAFAELKSRAFRAQAGQQAAANLDFVAALPEWNGDGVHGRSMATWLHRVKDGVKGGAS